MSVPEFFNRDLSWLRFNGQVLEEAAKPTVPLLNRIGFLAIFSSNLDEFYRVRVPVAMALGKIEAAAAAKETLINEIRQVVNQQQHFFGTLLSNQILPELKNNNIDLVYNEPFPEELTDAIETYFFSTLTAYLQIIYLNNTSTLFLENNLLYLVVELSKNDNKELAIVTIPSNLVSRFFSATINEQQYIVFIDDIIKKYLPLIFTGFRVERTHSIKVTRDAELNIQDEYSGDIAEKIETQILLRDQGLATRFLYSPDMSEAILQEIIVACKMKGAATTKGGRYHNLKDFFLFPVYRPHLKYLPQPPVYLNMGKGGVFDFIQQKDAMVHTPYIAYDAILRFFNEAAIHPEVEEIYTTMYRVASDSKIAYALISAAKNGKKVTAFVELKARFDEANNIKWAKVMKAAGVTIIYSIPRLKVHAKVTLVKRKNGGRSHYYGLFSTGNFNEQTARIYTDHILMTANSNLLRELELLFIFLSKRRKPKPQETSLFQDLLVAQFNLKRRFEELIDREISNARKGQNAVIRIKLNNLEEEGLINKLYEASNAGVTVQLMVRSICRLIPGVKGQSENITVKSIVDRYLEHGRVFVFHNNGNPSIYLGSADWMNRNIYSRIEVCFPLYDPQLKQEILSIINMQWGDNEAAVLVNEKLQSVTIKKEGAVINAQNEIYSYIQKLYKK